MKYLISILILFSLFSCSTTFQKGSKFKVEYKGALKNMMHKGDISAKADLNDFKNTKHLYALGAVEKLKGEILIMNSKPYISSARGQEVSISHSMDHKAALLVYAAVNKWKTLDIPASVSSYEQLEFYIEEAAKREGINTTEPFPFLLEGVAKSFDWHVIDWKEGDSEHSHEKHIKSGPNGSLENQEVKILGFYSNSHHAIFTHHSTNMHLHVKTTDDKLSGHLDGLIPGQGMTLKLPDVE